MSEDIRVDFVSGPEMDPAEIDALTRALRAEILQVEEVDRVEQPSAGPAPEGAKGLDVTAVIFNNRSYAILNIELQRVEAQGAGPRAKSQPNSGDDLCTWTSRTPARSRGVSSKCSIRKDE